MTRMARFAGLLAVLLIVGLAGVAWGANGAPLILGQDNTASSPTTLTGPSGIALGVKGNIDVAGTVSASRVQTTLAPYCSGIINVPAGKASGLSGFTSGDCGGLGLPEEVLVATIYGKAPSGVWVASIRNIRLRDQPNILVRLNVHTPVPLTVAFIGFLPSFVLPPPAP